MTICKSLLLANLIAISVLAPTQNTRAQLITLDPAVLAQTITGYITNLENMVEQIQHTSLLDNQYLQLLTQYNQMLREYDHLLNQLQGIRHSISQPDWDWLVRQTEQFYGLSDFGRIASLDPSSPNFNYDLARILQGYGYQPESPDEIVDYASIEAGIDDPDLLDRIEAEAERIDLEHELFRNQQAMVAQNENDSAERKERINDMVQILDSLGDESDLATLQLMALQTQFSMDQSEAAIQIANQSLMQANLPHAEQKAREAHALMAELQRLKRVADDPPRPYGSDSIGGW